MAIFRDVCSRNIRDFTVNCDDNRQETFEAEGEQIDCE